MTIHSYDYIPDKFNFLKTNDDEADCMYLGVELEVDEGGKDDENAEKIKNMACCSVLTGMSVDFT